MENLIKMDDLGYPYFRKHSDYVITHSTDHDYWLL